MGVRAGCGARDRGLASLRAGRHVAHHPDARPARARMAAPPSRSSVGRTRCSHTAGRARRSSTRSARLVRPPPGPRVSVLDRMDATNRFPSLIIWGERDRVVPVSHGQQVHHLIPHTYLSVFNRAGHFPHRDDPARFVQVVNAFSPGSGGCERVRRHWERRAVREMLGGNRGGESGQSRWRDDRPGRETGPYFRFLYQPPDCALLRSPAPADETIQVPTPEVDSSARERAGG